MLSSVINEMTLIDKKNKGPISESKKRCFFANVLRSDCPIDALLEKSTFPHHLKLNTQLEVSENRFQRKVP